MQMAQPWLTRSLFYAPVVMEAPLWAQPDRGHPANTYPNQTKALEDNTHFNPYGAYEVAKMVVMGMKQLNLPIVKYLRSDWKDYNPAQPDDFNQFVWYPSVNLDVTKPDGN